MNADDSVHRLKKGGPMSPRMAWSAIQRLPDTWKVALAVGGIFSAANATYGKLAEQRALPARVEAVTTRIEKLELRAISTDERMDTLANKIDRIECLLEVQLDLATLTQCALGRRR